jgi:hypothetical protein
MTSTCDRDSVSFGALAKKPPRCFAVWNQTTPTGQQNSAAAFSRAASA